METNNYSEYIEQQMKDPEFRAYYVLSREKAHLVFSIEQLKESIEKDTDKKTILRELNKLTKYIKHIAL